MWGRLFDGVWPLAMLYNGGMSKTADATMNEGTPGDVIKRKRLLARVAGQVASGLMVSPSPKVSSSEKIADVAVDVAEAILKKVGL